MRKRATPVAQVVRISRPLFSILIDTANHDASIVDSILLPQVAVEKHVSQIWSRNEVIGLMTTETGTSYRRTIIERIIPKRIKRVILDDYRDDSIILRRYLASETANNEFEQHKERALTESHRAGFMR